MAHYIKLWLHDILNMLILATHHRTDSKVFYHNQNYCERPNGQNRCGCLANLCGCPRTIAGAQLSIVGVRAPTKVYILTPMYKCMQENTRLTFVL